MTVHKTIIQVEILTDGEYTPETLAQIAQDMISGDASGNWGVTSQTPLKDTDAARELERQGSDPAFLLGEDHPLVTMDDEKRQALYLAHNFVQAGYGVSSIEPDTLKAIGVEVKGDYEGWQAFCETVYKQLTGEDIEPSRARGQGFRSQYYGKEVAKAIRTKFELPDTL